MPEAVNQPLSSAPAPEVAVSIVFLTKNESASIGRALNSCGRFVDIHVVDSGSTDGTQEIAAQLGASIARNPFRSFAQQRNWALENLNLRYRWVLFLDADEEMTTALASEIHALVSSAPEQDAFYIPSKLMLNGKWLRRVADYPVYQARMVRRGSFCFVDHGHGQREPASAVMGYLKEPYMHHAYVKGLANWMEKHIRYGQEDAAVMASSSGRARSGPGRFPSRVGARRFIKARARALPFFPFLRWFWALFLRGGVLEGREGRLYAKMQLHYDLSVSLWLSARGTELLDQD